MKYIDYFSIKVDDIQKNDIRNGYYMMELIGDDEYTPCRLPIVSIRECFDKSIGTFKLYKDDNIVSELNKKIRNKDINYMSEGIFPFMFNTELLLGCNEEIAPTIIYPYEFDKASYAFLGHEFNHSLKDTSFKEIKVKNRVNDVIPLFYERVCAENEINEDISVEILKRRLLLLRLDKEVNDDLEKQLQYFNSYYYALALYKRYKKDKILVLRLISRVLHGEISTLDLLNMLNIYNNDFDYVVSRELETIKEYVL